MPSVSKALGQAANFAPGAWTRYNGAAADLGTQGTIEFWLNPRSYADQRFILFNWNQTDTPPPDGYVFGVVLQANGRILLSSEYGPGCEAQVLGLSVIPLNTWTHVAVSWGTTISKIYVNGVIDNTSTACFRPIVENASIYVNSWGSTDLGYLDELFVSKIQRTDAEIQSDAGLSAPVCGTRLSIARISPATGGNNGSVTARIQGCAFSSGATAMLSGLGGSIVGTNKTLLNAGILATSSLRRTPAKSALRLR